MPGALIRRIDRERPLSAVPWPVAVVLISALGAQLYWHAANPSTRVARAEALPAPPSASVLAGAALGDSVAFAKLLMLWLQGFDNQPGISVPFRRLDYARISTWLDRIIGLDPRSHYALLSAARVYGDVADPGRQRQMIDFVREKFMQMPDQRWPWMAQAVFIAKHELRDLPLALQLSRELRLQTHAGAAPSWARQMELFVLEDMGDTESAKVLLGGLIASGAVRDAHELRFLKQRFGLETDAAPGK
jgi:hypothetical protein